MSVELVSILVLVAVFLAGTVLPINMGALALVAAYVVGVYVVDPGTLLGEEDNVDGVFLGFPGDLFVILVGVTYLFAIATNNGTVDWLIQAAVRAVGGRTVAIPWVMFLVTAILTASGAVVPGAVAIVAATKEERKTKRHREQRVPKRKSTAKQDKKCIKLIGHQPHVCSVEKGEGKGKTIIAKVIGLRKV